MTAIQADVRSPEREATTMAFATGESSLGLVLVARSEAGISAVLFGDEHDALRGDLRRRFPSATLVEGAEDLEALVRNVIAVVESPARGPDVAMPALDLRGTAFQRMVWQTLREIPVGSLATYTEIADRIGRPSAVRAVAQACAANNIAVLVPCHRVVRRDGDVSGYRWGLERKRVLLRREEGVRQQQLNPRIGANAADGRE